MGFVIINKTTGKRAKETDRTITPWFEYKTQAVNYIIRRLGDSPYLKVKEVRK